MFSSGFESRFSSNTNININVNFNSEGVGGAGNILTDLLSFLKPAGDSSDKFFTNFQGIRAGDGGCYHPAPVERPAIEDNGGSLKVDGNKVTTAGGYTIETLGATEWKITGPDGKSTRIWGDPHVHEGDREGGTAEGNGGWDFKRDSTFVLGDGTRINVTCVPGGAAGATVSGKLEIISGNDRAVAENVDKGQAKFGTVTQDGYAHANSFRGDVFVQGREADDWSFNGKEILGSEKQGESFKLGGDLYAGGSSQNNNTRGIDQMFDRFISLRNRLMDSLTDLFKGSFIPENRFGTNPYTGNTRPSWENNERYDRNQHRTNLTRSFNQLSRMFDMLARMSNMSDRLSTMRFQANIYA